MAGTLNIPRFCLINSYVAAVSSAETRFLVNVLTTTWGASPIRYAVRLGESKIVVRRSFNITSMKRNVSNS